jgi:S-adenosyl methyltransferase
VTKAVRAVNPDARVCYVDNDPAAARHAAVLLADGDVRPVYPLATAAVKTGD